MAGLSSARSDQPVQLRTSSVRVSPGVVASGWVLRRVWRLLVVTAATPAALAGLLLVVIGGLLWSVSPLLMFCLAEQPHYSGSPIAADLLVSGAVVKGERSESAGPEGPLTAGPETRHSPVGETEPPTRYREVMAMTRTKATSPEVVNEALPVLMTTREVAHLLRVDASTLSRWRLAGIGPQVTWLSPNLPRYQRVHVLAWLQRVAA